MKKNMANNKNQSNNKDKNNQNNQHDNFDWRRASKTSFIWLIIIFSAVYISGLLTDAGKKEIEIDYTEYRKYLKMEIYIKLSLWEMYFMESLKPLSQLAPL